MFRNSILGNERGNILIVTLLILFGVSVLGTTLATMSSTDMKISSNQNTNTQALYVAEAGLNEAIHRLSIEDPSPVSVGGWTGNAAIRDTDPYDPNWEARIYLTTPGAAPASNGSVATFGTLQAPGSYLDYSGSTGSDGVLSIKHKWRDLNGDGIRDNDEVVRWDPNKIPSENFSTGSPIEIITVTGAQGGARRIIQAEVMRGIVSGAGAANTLAAVYGNSQLQVVQNYGICGYNHDIATPPGTTPMACFGFHVGSGDLPGVSGTGGASIQVDPGGDITGFPTPTDNSPKPWLECWEILGISQADFNTMLSSADHTSVQNTMHGISYFSDCVIEKPVVGSGLLYATGKIDIKDDFEWTGLIYAKQQISFDCDKAWVIGSACAGGEVTWKPYNGNGEQGVLFSAEAIWQIIGGGGSNSDTSASAVTVLSWREL